MQIYMSEVNFGEAILLEQDDHKLLVDCGAKYGQKGVTAANAVQSRLVGENKEALVTHFDEDHYNGLTELAGKVKFKQIYLPLYSYSKKKGVVATSGLLNDIVKIWAYQKVMRKGKNLDALHRFFISLPQLVDSKMQVRCVGKGDVISCGNKQLNVLWPEYTFTERKKVYSDEIEHMLWRCDSADLNTCVESVNKYTEALIDVYATYVEHESFTNERLLLAQLQSAYIGLNEINLGITLNEKDYKHFSYILSTKIKCMNDCSVVLGSEDELLMLGDIGKHVFEYEICPHLTREYKVIKVSHHGTKTYYSDRIPTAKVFLVSNSGRQNMNWRIYEEYPRRFSNNMRCTNTIFGRCNPPVSQCGMCCIGQPSGDWLIDIDTL